MGDWWGWREPQPLDLVYTINLALYLAIIGLGMAVIELRATAATRTPSEQSAWERTLIRALLWAILLALVFTGVQLLMSRSPTP